MPIGNTTSCGGRSPGRSRATTRPTRAAPAPSRSATNGWPGTTVEHGRIAEGYGALIEYLVSECRRHGAALHLGAAVTAIDEAGGRIAVRCRDGAIVRGRCRDPYRAAAAPVRNRASAGGARAGSSRRRYRVRQRRQDSVALRNEVVGRSWRAGSGRFVVPAFRRDGPDLVDPASGRLSGADGLVRGTQGRQGVVTHREPNSSTWGSPRSPRFSICLWTASGGISSRRERSTGATTRSRAAPIPTPRPEHAKRSRC